MRYWQITSSFFTFFKTIYFLYFLLHRSATSMVLFSIKCEHSETVNGQWVFFFLVFFWSTSFEFLNLFLLVFRFLVRHSVNFGIQKTIEFENCGEFFNFYFREWKISKFHQELHYCIKIKNSYNIHNISFIINKM